MPSANLDLVRSLYADWGRGDFSSVEWAHPEVEFVIADGPSAGSWTGLAGMAGGWRDVLSAWDHFESRVDEYRELDNDRVLVLVYFTGRGKASGLEASQWTRTKGGVNLFYVRGGKVTKLVIYFDRERALAELGCSRGRLSDTADALATDGWDPTQYERFSDERTAPFFDLLALVEPCPGGRVVDLGCGTGELTRVLHERTGASATLGIDSSEAMLERSKSYAGDGLSFELMDIGDWQPTEPLDLVFSNAALHWMDDHRELFRRLTATLRSGGQLAVQMPANHDHGSHLVAEHVASEEPFREALGGYVRKSPVLSPEVYAVMLDRLGYASQHVRLQVYLHVLPEPGAVVDWVKGTLLTDYKRRLPDALYERFVARYRDRLLAELGDERPFRFTFKRLLLWGKLR